MLKLLLAVPLLLVSLAFCFMTAMVGLWCVLGFTAGCIYATYKLRRKYGNVRDWVYYAAFIAAFVLEATLLSLATEHGWFGMHKIFEGYAAPVWGQSLMAFLPVAFYAGCIRLWASRPPS